MILDRTEDCYYWRTYSCVLKPLHCLLHSSVHCLVDGVTILGITGGTHLYPSGSVDQLHYAWYFTMYCIEFLLGTELCQYIAQI